MRYLLIALGVEAMPLIQTFRLKKIKGVGFRLYANDDTLLCIGGSGMEQTAKALRKLLRYRPPQANDAFFNIGICAADASYAIGEILSIDEVAHDDTVLSLPRKEETTRDRIRLLTCKEACDTVRSTPVDMEAFAAVEIARRSFRDYRVIKIVSDRFNPSVVTHEHVDRLLRASLPMLKFIINSIK